MKLRLHSTSGAFSRLALPHLRAQIIWQKQHWDEIDMAGGVVRLSPARSKTLVGRILPISPPIAEALARRRARRDPVSPLVFHRDGIPVRRWRTAWRTACQAAGVPTRFLHDCRRTAARNLIRASVPERVAMLLTGHKSRAIFDRYNIINEQEPLEAGDQLVAYLAQQAPARRRPTPGTHLARPRLHAGPETSGLYPRTVGSQASRPSGPFAPQFQQLDELALVAFLAARARPAGRRRARRRECLGHEPLRLLDVRQIDDPQLGPCLCWRELAGRYCQVGADGRF